MDCACGVGDGGGGGSSSGLWTSSSLSDEAVDRAGAAADGFTLRDIYGLWVFLSDVIYQEK